MIKKNRLNFCKCELFQQHIAPISTNISFLWVRLCAYEIFFLPPTYRSDGAESKKIILNRCKRTNILILTFRFFKEGILQPLTQLQPAHFFGI